MLKVGILGGGINSAVGKAHLSALSIDRNWDIAAGLFSRDDKINTESQLLWSSKRHYFSLEQFIEVEQGKLDAVIVLTPTPTHYEIIKKLLIGGFDVISEKSLTTNFEESYNLDEIARKYNRRIYVTFNYTGYPMIRELRARIISGKYGDLKSIFIEMPQDTFSVVNDQGQTRKIQEWRKVDYDIPTVSLDLGVHVNNLAHFLVNDSMQRVVSMEQHNGKIEEAVDTVCYLAEFRSGILGNFWFGKSFLGHRNGLRVRGFGESGSFEWVQNSPDVFWESSFSGDKRLVDLADGDLLTASKERYMRFKPGHPTGFIEAFSNLYEDIKQDFTQSPKQTNEYVFHAQEASLGLMELSAVHQSSKTRKWEEVSSARTLP